jgi:hypothetical protein
MIMGPAYKDHVNAYSHWEAWAVSHCTAMCSITPPNCDQRGSLEAGVLVVLGLNFALVNDKPLHSGL